MLNASVGLGDNEDRCAPVVPTRSGYISQLLSSAPAAAVASGTATGVCQGECARTSARPLEQEGACKGARARVRAENIM